MFAEPLRVDPSVMATLPVMLRSGAPALPSAKEVPPSAVTLPPMSPSTVSVAKSAGKVVGLVVTFRLPELPTTDWDCSVPPVAETSTARVPPSRRSGRLLPERSGKILPSTSRVTVSVPSLTTYAAKTWSRRVVIVPAVRSSVPSPSLTNSAAPTAPVTTPV